MATPPETPRRPLPIQTGRYGRWLAVIGVLFLIGVTVNTLLTKAHGATGLPAGAQAPAFAVPLAQGRVEGDADIARHANEGENGKVPACKERGEGIFNICELWERGPVVLALFVNSSSCPNVLAKMQALSASFPSVSFAAVQVRGSRAALRRLLRRRGVTIPVGYDRRGDVAVLYQDASCPQVNFLYPGGKVQSKALLTEPSTATLRSRVRRLISETKAHGAGA